MSSVEGVSLGLVGRDRELARLEDLLRRAGVEGDSLVVQGEAGVGKSALIAEASHRARELGMQVTTTIGVQSEAHLPFAALHQLLRPWLPRVDALQSPQRNALFAAFGMADKEEAPDPFLIALAALELLGDQAARSPVLLVVEDAQWIDRASADALLFVARRVGMEPIVLLFAVREGLGNDFVHAELPSLEVDPLDPLASSELLDVLAPDLEPDTRARVLDEAAGNPLALVELPLALRSASALESVRDPLPLTAKLERVFAARVSELPDQTRALLLAAAASEGGALTELLAAASALTGTNVTVKELEPAVAAGTVEIDQAGLRFRHPLVSSAVYRSSGIGERNRAHAALADASPADSDRRVWHRAASVLAVDEEISSQLEEVAVRALRRGAAGAAAAALERAAQLTATGARRGSLLLRAATIEWQLGHPELIVRLLHEAELLELSGHDRARLGLMLEVFDDRGWSGASRAFEVVAIADELLSNGDSDGALDALLGFALRCWWGNPDDETRRAVVGAAERIGLDNSPGVLEVVALADPVGRGASVVERLSRTDEPDDPIAALHLGTAAAAVWAFDRAVPFYETAISGMRAQGRLGWLTQALGYQAWAAVHVAKEELAVGCAEESVRLAHETRQPRWAAIARIARAAIAVERGDSALASDLTAEAERILVRQGVHPLLALIQFVRGRDAIVHQRYDEGLDHLRRILDPSDLAYQPVLASWAYADLVEAAASTGNFDLAKAHLQSLESLAAATAGPMLEAQAAFARPIVADDDEAEVLFRVAIGTSLAEWQSFRGRALLRYGSWLRRQRRVAESRTPLRAARDLFDALRFRSMADRARQELRASGETSRRRVPEARDELTPQELQIARMAAEGLSNREIAQRLYLSHRTVGSHLYRIFPKLGVTSRSQLAAVLDS